MIYNNILETIGNTPIVRLNSFGPDHIDIYGKVESFNPLGSVKDRLAIAIIIDAEKRGTLKPGQTVIEATSGNTGISLAMVCAAKGCPVLSRRPYRAATVDAQLDEAVRAFAADTRRVVFHRASRRLEGSQLLDWYGGDWTNPEYDPHAKSVPAFLARYVPDEDLARLLRAERWKMTPIEYDWKVNLKR